MGNNGGFRKAKDSPTLADPRDALWRGGGGRRVLKVDPDIDFALIKLGAGRAGKDLDIGSRHPQLPIKLLFKFEEAKKRSENAAMVRRNSCLTKGADS